MDERYLGYTEWKCALDAVHTEMARKVEKCEGFGWVYKYHSMVKPRRRWTRKYAGQKAESHTDVYIRHQQNYHCYLCRLPRWTSWSAPSPVSGRLVGYRCLNWGGIWICQACLDAYPLDKGFSPP
jgi:hypothetical protein